MHKQYEELLVKYNNGICTQEESELVKNHIKNCDECKKALMEMQFDIEYKTEESAEINLNVAQSKKKKRTALIIAVVMVMAVVVAGVCYFYDTKENLVELSQKIMEFYKEDLLIVDMNKYRVVVDENGEIVYNLESDSDGTEEVYIEEYIELEGDDYGLYYPQDIESEEIEICGKMYDSYEDIQAKLVSCYQAEYETGRVGSFVDYASSSVYPSEGQGGLSASFDVLASSQFLGDVYNRRINDIEVQSISLSEATVYVYSTYNTIGSKYVINYKKNNGRWEIKSFDFEDWDMSSV